MIDRILLENQVAIMSALVELAHAVGYGTKVRTETIATLRERVQESDATLALVRWRSEMALEAAHWERTRISGGLD